MANPSSRGGKKRGLQTYKAKSVDTGRPLTGAISAINLPQAILIVCYHVGRSREIWHYFTFPHYHFSFCFAIITSEAEGQSEKNTGFTISEIPFCILGPPHWLRDPGQASSVPQFPHRSSAGDNHTRLSTYMCTAHCPTRAGLKS